MIKFQNSKIPGKIPIKPGPSKIGKLKPRFLVGLRNLVLGEIVFLKYEETLYVCETICDDIKEIKK